MKHSIESNSTSKLPYIFGGLAFIPLVGVIFGLLAIFQGIKIKKKLPVMLGSLGITLTVVIYGSLYYFGMIANYGPYHELKKQLTKQVLSQTRGQVLIYREKYGKLPNKLQDIGNPSSENFYTTTDPWMHNLEYKVNNDGTFELRSYGPDGLPHNKDDIISR